MDVLFMLFALGLLQVSTKNIGSKLRGIQGFGFLVGVRGLDALKQCKRPS